MKYLGPILPQRQIKSSLAPSQNMIYDICRNIETGIHWKWKQTCRTKKVKKINVKNKIMQHLPKYDLSI